MANYEGIVDRIMRVLPELTNVSAGSIWRRMAGVFASVVDIVQLELGRSEVRIETAARNVRVMGKQYYIDCAFAYQEGDTVVVVDEETLREGYAVVDAGKRIIKQVAVSVPGTGQIYVKAATADGEGNLVQLGVEQVLAFNTYMQRFAPLGVELTVFSAAADVFHATGLYVRYLSEYSLTVIQDALRSTLLGFQTVFNADVPVYLNDIEGAIKGIAGIRDVWFDGVTVTYEDAGGVQSVSPENGTLELNAGYFNFDPAIYDWESGVTVFEAV